MDAPVIDKSKLETFVMRAVGDLSAGYGGVMVSLGSKLGLYKAMAGAGPISSKELAARTGCAERYVREWLNAQAAGGYVGYHASSDSYELSPEQAMVLADEESPLYIPNAWNVPASMWFDEDKALEAFRTGSGVAWGDHTGRLYCGVAAFYRNAYKGSLLSEWLPALDGVVRAAAGGHCGGRHRLRPRPLDAADGRGVPALALPRLRYASGLDRRSPAQRGRGGTRRAGHASRWPALPTTPPGTTA